MTQPLALGPPLRCSRTVCIALMSVGPPFDPDGLAGPPVGASVLTIASDFAPTRGICSCSGQGPAAGAVYRDWVRKARKMCTVSPSLCISVFLRANPGEIVLLY